MRIRFFQEGDAEKWQEYVMSSGKSNCYHQIGWKKVIERSFGHRTHYLLAEDGAGAVRGIFPLVHIRSRIFGSFMVSLPYTYGGICADAPEIEQELCNEAVKIAAAEKAEHMEMRHTQPMALGLEEKRTKVVMKLDLPETSEKLWKSFSANLRNCIRRPLREDMTIRTGRHDELDNFYQVFSVNMRDLGTPVYTKLFFRNILDQFPDTAWIITVYLKDGSPAASGIFTGFKDKVEIPWASSLRSHNRYKPNMLLYWIGLKTACEKGYKAFDFGRCTPGEGTYKFKEQWGAVPSQMYWHYWMRNDGPMPEINPKNPKYRIAIKAWKLLPVSLTRLIGPGIARNLP